MSGLIEISAHMLEAWDQKIVDTRIVQFGDKAVLDLKGKW